MLPAALPRRHHKPPALRPQARPGQGGYAGARKPGDGELPILADALEDAGCADAAILAHCRGPGEHVRGCWVVDLLTGRG